MNLEHNHQLRLKKSTIQKIHNILPYLYYRVRLSPIMPTVQIFITFTQRFLLLLLFIYQSLNQLMVAIEVSPMPLGTWKVLVLFYSIKKIEKFVFALQ